jgi:hypothetical protein
LQKKTVLSKTNCSVVPVYAQNHVNNGIMEWKKVDTEVPVNTADLGLTKTG